MVTVEGHSLRVGGEENTERLQAGIFNLVLQIGGDLHLRLVDGGMLQAGDLNPRIHLFHIQRQLPRCLENAEGQHAFLPHPGFLRVELRHAFARRRLEAHPLLGHDEQRAALFASLAESHLRHQPTAGGFHTRPGKADNELLLALSLAGEVQGDDAAGFGFHFRPMAQRRAADGFHVEPRRQGKA